MSQTQRLSTGDSFTIEGPHGAYASIKLLEVRGEQSVLQIRGHRTSVKEGTPAGPLTLGSCEALMLACDKAREFLEANREKLPEAVAPLAMLAHANTLANRDLAKIEEPESERRPA